MKIYQRQLEECYRKLEQAEQVGKTRELRVSLGKVIDKIQLINTPRQQALPSAPCRGRTPCAPRCRPVHSALRRKPPILRQNLL